MPPTLPAETTSPTATHRLRTALGLQRNILVMLGILLVLGMGEELWMRFVPKYLEILGAGAWVIAAYGTLKDLLDALYQYPGGWLTDRLGRRRALVSFALIATVGYIVYLISPNWEWILVGTIFVMAWSSLTSPAVFAIIGDSLPQERRAIGFGVQSMLKRIPIVLAPALGGLLIATAGFQDGMRIGLAITIAMALIGIAFVARFFRETDREPFVHTSLAAQWRSMDRNLKNLLVADCLARWAEGIPKVFIVLFALNVLGVGVAEFGFLTSLQMATSILVYIPIAKLSDRLNRKPFVLLTFAFFALFPLVLASATSAVWIVLAFVVAGLREVGEPARKALIVDLAHASARGRAVGIYYLIRGLAVFPASIVGGWLWTIDPKLTFYAAFVVGVAGFVTYVLIGRQRVADRSNDDMEETKP